MSLFRRKRTPVEEWADRVIDQSIAARRSAPIRRPKTKRCQHFEAVADAAQRVVSGELPPSRQAATTLAEEYLLLHLEFQALMTHLEDR